MEFQHERLREYRYVDSLGSGGFGDVYKVTDSLQRRIYALKILKQDTYLEWFKREVEILEQLNHSNIISIYDSSFEPSCGESFILMEYMKYGNVEEYLAKHPDTNCFQKLLFIKDTAKALRYAHQKNILHRDVKPQNIFITDNDSGQYACLGDFGIAKDTQEETIEQTAAGVQSENYLPLEYFYGDGDKTELTDLYALGMSMYEIFAGRHAFDVSNKAIFFRQMKEEEALPPSTYQQSISEEVDRICLKAIAREKKDRYKSVDEFIGDLEKCVKAMHSTSAILYSSQASEKSGSKDTETEDEQREVMNEDEGLSYREQEITNRERGTRKVPYIIGACVMIGITLGISGYLSNNFSSTPSQLVRNKNTEKSKEDVNNDINKKISEEQQNSQASTMVVTRLKMHLDKEEYNKIDKQEYEQAVKHLKLQASKGDDDAAYYLGKINDVGYGQQQDYVKALEWYKKAYEKKDCRGLQRIGDIYRFGGHGVEIDYTKVITWYTEAAEKGNTKVYVDLGNLYHYNEGGIEKNYFTAYRYYSKALKEEHIEVYDELGDLFGSGHKEFQKDSMKALQWYLKAAEEGDKSVYKKIGDLYQYADNDTQGLQRSYVKALDYYTKALREGNQDVYKEIGDLYYLGGSGLEANWESAIRWYKRMPEQWDKNLFFTIGSAYHYGGNGLEMNYEQARIYYIEAKKLGHEGVDKQIKELGVKLKVNNLRKRILDRRNRALERNDE